MGTEILGYISNAVILYGLYVGVNMIRNVFVTPPERLDELKYKTFKRPYEPIE